MDKKTLMKKAKGEMPAQTVFKNGRVINVYTHVIETVDIAVEDGIIIGIGTYKGEEEIDLQNRYVSPGFLDGHVHIESSMVTPPQFASIILPKGTTTIIADPHEIANVSGVAGIEFMINAAKNSLMDAYFMLPSSVPATTFETAGAKIGPEDILALKDKDNVLGLGEVMNYPGVLSGEKDIHEKIQIMQGRPIDGHAPSVIGNELNAYILAGVQSDHECSSVEEMEDRLRKGMYVHLREGSVTRNVATLLKGITPHNMRRTLFCTDDKHPEDIKREGHINYNVNLAIKTGIDAIDAITMATLNAAECYGLKHLGAIAPGKQADFFTFNSLESITPIDVYKKGTLVAREGKLLITPQASMAHNDVQDSVHIDAKAIDFTLKLSQDDVRVIGLIKNNITTNHLIRKVSVAQGVYHNNPEDDILKLAVIERHKQTNNVGLGLVEGFGIKNGALAMTIAHDSHNLVIVGDSDDAMRKAMEKIIAIKGGIVLVKDNKVVHALPLEISGIMTASSPDDVAKMLEKMKQTTREMGLNKAIDDPFIQLAFLSLPVIPKLKLTDQGLFDVETFQHVSIECDSS